MNIPRFEHTMLAVRYLVPDNPQEKPLASYVYACRLENAYGNRWAYTVVLVDLSVGVIPGGETMAGSVYRSERPFFTHQAVAEEYRRVTGVEIDVEELRQKVEG